MAVRKALAAHPDIRAVFVGDPSYVGTVVDVAGLAEAAHEHNVPLVVDAAWAAHFGFHPDLPRHPLEAEGFASIGCAPCTSKVKPGEDPRSGRWRGWDKTECGIHGPADESGGDEGELPPGYEPAF